MVDFVRADPDRSVVRVVTGVVVGVGARRAAGSGLVSLRPLARRTMIGAIATHVFVLHTSPVPAIVLGVSTRWLSSCGAMNSLPAAPGQG